MQQIIHFHYDSKHQIGGEPITPNRQDYTNSSPVHVAHCRVSAFSLITPVRNISVTVATLLLKQCTIYVYNALQF